MQIHADFVQFPTNGFCNTNCNASGLKYAENLENNWYNTSYFCILTMLDE